MANEDKSRRGVLSNFLGITGAQNVEKTAAEIDKLLKKIRMDHKQLKSLTTNKGFVQDMQAELLSVLQKYDENASEDLAAELTAAAVGSMLQGGGEAAPEEDMPAEEMPMEGMEGDPTMEDEFREFLGQFKEMQDTTKDVLQETYEFTQILMPTLKMFAEFAPVISAMKGYEPDKVIARIKALEAKVSTRPRQASQATSTLASDKEVETLTSETLEDVPDVFRTMFNQNGK